LKDGRKKFGGTRCRSGFASDRYARRYAVRDSREETRPMGGNLVVTPVRTRAEMLRFMKFPWRVYAGDPHWVAPLLFERKRFFNPRRNPFFAHAEAAYFTAARDGALCGTIAACVDYNYVRFQNDQAGLFGFFEVLPDYEAAAQLLDAAREWLRRRGMRVMRGPFNFSTNQEVGLLTDGFGHDPVVLTTYNPPYYQELVERYGLVKARDMYAYWLDAGPPPRGMVQAAERVRQRAAVVIRRVNLRDFQTEALRIREIYNRAWSQNWGFVPLTEEEVLELARGLKLIVDPDLTLFAELDGEPVGFVICIPDINRAIKPLNGRLFPFGWLRFLRAKRRLNFVRIFTLGVIPERHPIGIGALLYQHVWEAGLRKGYVAGEMSWILEDNAPMNAAMQMMGGRIYKTWRIYDLPLR
jgi:GNAT superfamily N-acetyltransferase